jgi:hypothetical protein
MKKMHDAEGRGNVIRVIVKYRGAYYEQLEVIKRLSRSRREYDKLGNKERVEAYDVDLAKRKQVADFLISEIRYLSGELEKLDEVA